MKAETKPADMSNLRSKRRAKIHPSPPPPPSPLSALYLLPPTLLTIVSLLSPSDRQVLAYLILHSLQNPTASAPRPPATKCANPAFDCGCFDCYTSFWVRWDASPNRDLIHQAIEAFEDHIADLSANTHKAISPRRAPCGRWSTQTQKGNYNEESISAPETTIAQEENAATEEENEEEEANFGKASVRRSAGSGGGGNSSRKGLVRKVWPDVLGLCNSRLWSLWCPNM